MLPCPFAFGEPMERGLQPCNPPKYQLLSVVSVVAGWQSVGSHWLLVYLQSICCRCQKYVVQTASLALLLVHQPEVQLSDKNNKRVHCSFSLYFSYSMYIFHLSFLVNSTVIHTEPHAGGVLEDCTGAQEHRSNPLSVESPYTHVPITIPSIKH